MEYAKEIADALLEKKAIKLQPKDPFTWTSGIKSPIYCDNRMLISHPDAYDDVIDGFIEIIETKEIEFDYIAGTSTAGIPWAAFLAYELGLPMVYVRSTPKGHGAGKQIEGDIEPGQKVLVVEDLVSTGGSSVKTVEVLRNEAKAEVADILAIFSYDFAKAETACETAKVNLHTVTNIHTLLDVAVEKGAIKAEEKDMVIKFTQNPQDWQ